MLFGQNKGHKCVLFHLCYTKYVICWCRGTVKKFWGKFWVNITCFWHFSYFFRTFRVFSYFLAFFILFSYFSGFFYYNRANSIFNVCLTPLSYTVTWHSTVVSRGMCHVSCELHHNMHLRYQIGCPVICIQHSSATPNVVYIGQVVVRKDISCVSSNDELEPPALHQRSTPTYSSTTSLLHHYSALHQRSTSTYYSTTSILHKSAERQF